MPSTTILGWGSSSLTFIQNSVNHLLNSNSLKREESISPFITSIQTIKGKTPGDKYKQLNYLIRAIIENTPDIGEFTKAKSLHGVSPALTPYVKTIIGVDRQINQIIIDGLKSKNSNVIKKALRANFFFKGTKEHVNVDNFVQNIMPYVSLKTRCKIMKKLSHSLVGNEKKAEAFFEAFVELYGVGASLPILNACSATFIYERILLLKIDLPLKIVDSLYKKYPDLVIRYLQLGNKKNEENKEDRIIHEIKIYEYDKFISKLIKNHPEIFIQLYELTPEKEIKLNNKEAELFFKSLKTELINRPKIYLKLLPLKMVNKNLNSNEFDNMLQNLFPPDDAEFNLDEMLDYLEYYTGDKVELLKEKYNIAYNKDLLDIGATINSLRFFKLLPDDEKEARARILLEKYDQSHDLHNKYTSYLPPSESLPILKEKISRATNAEDRTELIDHMIVSCSIYKSKEHLLDVLQFYKDRHKNERNVVLCQFFQYLKQEMDLKTLGEDHWLVLKQIIDHAHVKNELTSHATLIESVLEALLFSVITYHRDNQVYIDKVFDLIVECKMNFNLTASWNILKDNPEQERNSIEKFFQIIPLKYPESDPIWKNKNDRLSFALSFVKSIDDYNKRNYYSKLQRKPKKNKSSLDVVINKIKIEDYPWILKLTEEFFSKSFATRFKANLLMKLLKKNTPEFYETKVDQYSTIRSIETGEALSLLRREPKRILGNWPDYLAEAKEKLISTKHNKAARRFVAATKWHEEIPVKFIERSLIDLKDEGSVYVLAILLEGEDFEKIVAPFIPKEKPINLDKNDAKENYQMACSIIKAMRYTNPPVSLDYILPFCHGDYASLTNGTLMSVAQRIPADNAIEFAKKLVNHTIVAKKIGIRLLQKVATNAQLKEVLEAMCRSEKSQSTRQIVMKMIFYSFTRSPTATNCEMVKNCISELTINDLVIVEKFANIDRVDSAFVSEYIDAYLKMIEKLFVQGMNCGLRTKCVCLVIESIDAKIMRYTSEEVCRGILNRYFFDTDSPEISRAARNFAIRSYLLTANETFEHRLKEIMNILTKVMENFDTPHPKKQRFYASNYCINEFFSDLITEIAYAQCEHSEKIIDSLLNVFNSSLSPWQDPHSYMSLKLYKEYLAADSPHSFGYRCAQRMYDFIEDFAANESVLIDTAKIMDDFLSKKIYTNVKPIDLKLQVIEGLLEDGEFYGASLSIKLLKEYEVDIYDSRYDTIIRTLRQKPNKVILYEVYKHLNRIEFNGDDT